MGNNTSSLIHTHCDMTPNPESPRNPWTHCKNTPSAWNVTPGGFFLSFFLSPYLYFSWQKQQNQVVWYYGACYSISVEHHRRRIYTCVQVYISWAVKATLWWREEDHSRARWPRSSWFITLFSGFLVYFPHDITTLICLSFSRNSWAGGHYVSWY